MSRPIDSAELVLEYIREAHLPHRLHQELLDYHTAALERRLAGTDLNEILEGWGDRLKRWLPEWRGVFAVDPAGSPPTLISSSSITGEAGVSARGLWSKLLELPEAGTLYRTGDLSIDLVTWAKVLPDLVVRQFVVYPLDAGNRKAGVLLLTSDTLGELSPLVRQVGQLAAASANVASNAGAKEESVAHAPMDFLNGQGCASQALDLLREAVCVLDDSGGITHANHETARILGLPLEQLVGESIFRFSAGMEPNNRLRGLLEEKPVSCPEVCLRHHNGSFVWVEIEAKALDRESVGLSGTLIVIRNISDRKRTASQLEVLKGQLAAASQAPSVVMFQIDHRGIIVSAEGGFACSGRAQNLIGGRAWEFCSDVRVRRRLWKKLLREGRATERLKTDWGTLETTLNVATLKKGRPQIIHGFGIKLETVKTPVVAAPPPPVSEPAVPEWLGVLKTSSDGVVMLDAQAQVAFLNPAAEEMLKCKLAHVRGNPIKEICSFGELDLRRLFHSSRELWEESCVHQCQLTRADGSVIEIGVAGTPLKAGDGSPKGMVLCMREELAPEKEAVGTVVTVDAAQVEEESFKCLSLFAGGIAHDLNNILTSLVGNVSLANMLVTELPEVSERLVEAERACFRAKDLSHQLLTFAKGSAPMKKVARMEDLVQECIDLYLRSSKCITHVEHDSGLWSVDVDNGQISQVLETLVLNAERAMPHGGTITIQTENFHFVGNEETNELPLAEGFYVKLKVRDQGPGISPENVDHLFKPYYTATEAGSGLGLATSYAIIKNHGGHIEVNSSPKAGTEFALYIHRPVRPNSRTIPICPSPNPGRAMTMAAEFW